MEFVFPCAVGIAALLAYYQASYPSVAGGDSGELLSEACVGGVAHPPGYGLFLVLLSRFVDWFPSLRPGRVGALISVCCGGIAAVAVGAASAVWATTLRLDRGAAGLSASVFFAATPLVCEYSMHAEVFALNNALCALGVLIFLLIATSTSEPMVASIAGSMLLGLSVAHQHASLLSAIPLALSALVFLRRSMTPGWLFVLATTAAITWAIPTLVVMPRRSKAATEGSWGDLTTWAGVWRHVLRTEYGTFRLGAAALDVRSDNLARVYSYFEWTLAQIGGVASACAVGGLVVAFARDSAIACVIGGCWLFYVLAWHGIWSNLNIFDDAMAYEVHARFWMQPHVFACVAAGLGVAALEHSLCRVTRHNVRMVIRVATIAIVCGFAGGAVAALRDELDFGVSGWATHTHGEAILGSIPHGGLLLSHSDMHWNPTRYLRLCERQRPDVAHVSVQLVPYDWFSRYESRYPEVTFPRLSRRSTRLASPDYQHMLEALISANMKTFSSSGGGGGGGGVYVDMHGVYEPSIGMLGTWGSRYALVPWGLNYRVVYAQDVVAANASFWLEESVAQIAALRARYERSPPGSAPGAQFRAGSWERAVLVAYNDAHYQCGLWALTLAQELRKQLNVDVFPLYVRALREAVRLTSREGPLTSAIHDLHKNGLLAIVLLHGALNAALKMRQGAVHFATPPSRGELDNVTRDAVRLARRFVARYPDDKDVHVFSHFLKENA